jgi:hypothetical protein
VILVLSVRFAAAVTDPGSPDAAGRPRRGRLLGIPGKSLIRLVFGRERLGHSS